MGFFLLVCWDYGKVLTARTSCIIGRVSYHMESSIEVAVILRSSHPIDTGLYGRHVVDMTCPVVIRSLLVETLFSKRIASLALAM